MNNKANLVERDTVRRIISVYLRGPYQMPDTQQYYRLTPREVEKTTDKIMELLSDADCESINKRSLERLVDI